MGKDSILTELDLYIDEVSWYLPYPTEMKQDALDELRIDVQSAMAESNSLAPSLVFGSPHDVAVNLSQGNNWHHTRVDWVTRFFAWLIDFLFLMGILFFIIGGGFVLFDLTFMPWNEIVAEFTNWENKTIELSFQTILLIIFISILAILFFVIFIGYNIVLEHNYGTTVGKRLFHLYVVDQIGIKITWKQAFIRNFSKILVFQEFLPIDVILGMILERFDPEKTHRQRGMDILAETIVIKI